MWPLLQAWKCRHVTLSLFSHFHTFNLSHFCSFTLLNFYLFIPSHFHTFTLSLVKVVILSQFHSFKLLSSHTFKVHFFTLSHVHTFKGLGQAWSVWVRLGHSWSLKVSLVEVGFIKNQGGWQMLRKRGNSVSWNVRVFYKRKEPQHTLFCGET